MRALAVVLLVAGCAGPATPEDWVLTVVPSSGAPHIVDWRDLDDGSEVANFVEKGLENAHASPYGTSSQPVNGTLGSNLAKWMQLQQDVHNARPLPVRYEGRLFLVAFDAA